MMLNGFLKILQFTMKIWKVYHGLPLVFFILFFGGWVEMWKCVWVHTHVDFSSAVVFLYAPLTLVLNVLHR